MRQSVYCILWARGKKKNVEIKKKKKTGQRVNDNDTVDIYIHYYVNILYINRLAPRPILSLGPLRLTSSLLCIHWPEPRLPRKSVLITRARTYTIDVEFSTLFNAITKWLYFGSELIIRLIECRLNGGKGCVDPSRTHAQSEKIEREREKAFFFPPLTDLTRAFCDSRTTKG